MTAHTDGASRSPRHLGWAYGMLAVVMALWAGNSIIGRAVRDQIGPFTLAFLRWAGALLVLAPISFRRVRADRREIVRGWRSILLLGLTGVTCFNAFLYSGLRLTTATNALLIQAAIPGIVLVLDRLLFRVRPRLPQVAGVLISIGGVVLIVAHGQVGSLWQAAFNRGDLLVLCAVLAWAAYTACLRLRPQIHPSSLLVTTFAVGALAMAPLAILEQRSGLAIHWTSQTVAAIAYVAVLPSVAAYAMFNAAVARLGPVPAGQAINLMPVFGAGLAAATLGEPLHAYHATGMAMVLAGIACPWVTARFAPPVAA